MTWRLRSASGKLPRATLRPGAIQRCKTGGTAPRPPASPGEHARSPRKGSTAPDSIVFLNYAILGFRGVEIGENPPAGRKCVDHLSTTSHPHATTASPSWNGMCCPHGMARAAHTSPRSTPRARPALRRVDHSPPGCSGVSTTVRPCQTLVIKNRRIAPHGGKVAAWRQCGGISGGRRRPAATVGGALVSSNPARSLPGGGGLCRLRGGNGE